MGNSSFFKNSNKINISSKIHSIKNNINNKEEINEYAKYKLLRNDNFTKIQIQKLNKNVMNNFEKVIKNEIKKIETESQKKTNNQKFSKKKKLQKISIISKLNSLDEKNISSEKQLSNKTLGFSKKNSDFFVKFKEKDSNLIIFQDDTYEREKNLIDNITQKILNDLENKNYISNEELNDKRKEIFSILDKLENKLTFCE